MLQSVYARLKFRGNGRNAKEVGKMYECRLRGWVRAYSLLGFLFSDDDQVGAIFNAKILWGLMFCFSVTEKGMQS